MKSMNEIERIVHSNLDKSQNNSYFSFHSNSFLLLKIYFPCLALGPRKTKHVCTNLIDICC